MCFCFIIMPDISVYLFCQPSPTINSKTLQLENKRNIPNHNVYQFCPLKIACVPLQFIYNQWKQQKFEDFCTKCIKPVKAYRGKVVFLQLSIRREQIHWSYHRDGPLPPGLNVPIHAAAFRVLSVHVCIITSAVFTLQWICTPFLRKKLANFLGDGMFPGKQLSIVRNGPWSRAPPFLSGLDRGCFRGRCGFICGRCGGYGWLGGGWWRDRRCAAGWRGELLRLKKSFSSLVVWRHLRDQSKKLETKLTFPCSPTCTGEQLSTRKNIC